MFEYRTKQIQRDPMIAELNACCVALRQSNLDHASVCFGWASNLPIDEMWKEQNVALADIAVFIADAEISGIVKVGESDISIAIPEFTFTLCHEGDVHVEGTSVLVQEFFRRWQRLDYSPYQVVRSGESILGQSDGVE
jgi:hypothetical protein